MLAALPLMLQATTPAPRAADRWFGADKVKHFLLGGFVHGVSHVGLRVVGTRHGQAQAGALAVVLGVGTWKEWRDRRAYGSFSVRDLTWTLAGGAASAVLQARAAR